MRRLPSIVLALLAISTTSTALAAQNGSSGDGQEWPLYGNLGPHSRTITTSSDTAQLYFNEGMQFMYAFGPSSALQSFQAAQMYDSECAMCYWGEAWAHSPYLNGRMNLESESMDQGPILSARRRAERGRHPASTKRPGDGVPLPVGRRPELSIRVQVRKHREPSVRGRRRILLGSRTWQTGSRGRTFRGIATP